jgi:hypothetical protein
MHGSTCQRTAGAAGSYGRLWTLTLFIAVPAIAAGVMNTLHVEPLFGIMRHLGYPAYFSTILGTWKVLGGLVLLAPGFPLVKEWAYAGLFIDYTGAVVSHSMVGDGMGANARPASSIMFLVIPYLLRPRSRRIPHAE